LPSFSSADARAGHIAARWATKSRRKSDRAISDRAMSDRAMAEIIRHWQPRPRIEHRTAAAKKFAAPQMLL